MSLATGPKYARGDFAGFIRRTLALLLDVLILIALSYAVPWGWYYLVPASWATEASFEWLDIGCMVASAAYLLGFRLSDDGTPGYRLVGIRYAFMLDMRPSLVWRLFRSVMSLFLLATFSLDHIWILFDRRKQAWHDKLSGFYVVKCAAKPIGSQRIVRRVITFMGLTLEVWEPEEGE